MTVLLMYMIIKKIGLVEFCYRSDVLRLFLVKGERSNEDSGVRF